MTAKPVPAGYSAFPKGGKIIRRYFWILTLVTFLSGCSYQHFGLPGETEPVPEVGGDLPAVEVGQQVTLVTVDGTRHDGEVVAVSGKQIVLGKVGNYGFEETVFPAEEIAEIKTQKVPGFVGVVAVATVVVFGLLILVASQIEWPAS